MANTNTAATLRKGDAALYNGKKFCVLFAGETRFGARAKLCWFSDERKAFWVDLSKVEPVTTTLVAKLAPAIPTFQVDAEKLHWRNVEIEWTAEAEREFENRHDEGY
jgi:hypothetical protein